MTGVEVTLKQLGEPGDFHLLCGVKWRPQQGLLIAAMHLGTLVSLGHLANSSHDHDHDLGWSHGRSFGGGRALRPHPLASRI